jgi:hypothetical protein
MPTLHGWNDQVSISAEGGTARRSAKCVELILVLLQELSDIAVEAATRALDEALSQVGALETREGKEGGEVPVHDVVELALRLQLKVKQTDSTRLVTNRC